MNPTAIQLRGVAVNNLRHVDLDLPRRRLIVICGVSGSGKTSLALDTLYAEGQRRYIETFSPYARQFLEQLDRPDAERIEGIPPAIAVTHKNLSRSSQATVGTTTEVNSYLSLLFTRVGEAICQSCGRPVRRDTPESVAELLMQSSAGQRIMLGFDAKRPTGASNDEWLAQLNAEGYVRAIIGERTATIEPGLAAKLTSDEPLTIVLDRLKMDDASAARLHDSLEAAFAEGACVVFIEGGEPTGDADACDKPQVESQPWRAACEVDGQPWRRLRFSSSLRCDECGRDYPGTDALAVHLAGKSFADICRMKISDAIAFLNQLQVAAWQQPIARPLVDDVLDRLAYLVNVGVGYLALDRPLRTLSGGEAQRVALTAALSSSLVDMLYVLDEPSVGLHPRDVATLATAVEGLHKRGNTVVVVEHEEEIIRRADQVVEIGPGAGDAGGQIVFQGTPAELAACTESRTGDWLAGRRRLDVGRRRATDHGWIKLRGARGHNLQNVAVEFPLGVLCLITGLSGAGKTTLVQKTLYPALVRCLNRDSDPASLPVALDYDDVLGAGQLDDVVLIDQTPIGRSPRSNPATYLKAFDPIRTLFAEQLDARTRGLSASHFSFNVDGGRCEKCRGDGYLSIDMQFLADVYMRCGDCGGRRYRRNVLEVKYRGRDIAEVLDMTAREAFTWFRGERAVQARLKPLLDVGLDYLRLGQPATTLSGGEAQRLKLAARLAGKRRGRTLFVLDEPTTGLHFSDIVQLVDCFDALLDVGHSLVVVEHNLQLMKAADYLIDLGPGAADEGGRVVATGTLEDVAACAESITGQFLARELTRDNALTE